MSLFAGKGSFFPSQLPKDIYKRIEEDVAFAVNLLMIEGHNGGRIGIRPDTNYNVVYDKRAGMVFVEFWLGDKFAARLCGKVQRFTVGEVCNLAQKVMSDKPDFERTKKKEVIF
jgi:hypothetical protein